VEFNRDTKFGGQTHATVLLGRKSFRFSSELREVKFRNTRKRRLPRNSVEDVDSGRDLWIWSDNVTRIKAGENSWLAAYFVSEKTSTC
jgi:hypothetical protein